VGLIIFDQIIPSVEILMMGTARTTSQKTFMIQWVISMKKWERESLTPEEIDLVLDAARNDEERAMMTTLADTGMRVNELLRLRRDWVHFPRRKRGITGLLKSKSHGFIRIPVNEDYTPVPGTKGRGPKTKRVRNVPMTSRLHDVLKEWFRDGHNGFFRTYNHVYDVCVRSGEAAGLYTITKLPHGKKYTVCKDVDHSTGFHLTPHMWRHTYITQGMYKTDLKDWEMGALAGHKDGSMVRVYLHVDEEETARKIEESGWLER
jgi:integrase